MGVLFIMLGAGLFLILGGLLYAPIIGRVLGEKKDRITPAMAINDGRDYVPTKTPVVFAHHYASIAGAGPIIGPIIALYYGWGPALLWILMGGVFLGAVHDYVSTHISMREGGKNLTVVARRYIGPAAFVLMLILLVSLLALVCAAFLDLSAKALTSRVAIETLKLDPAQSLLRVNNGEAVIGGIASTSVVVITLCSPLIGFLYLKKKCPVWICSLLAIGICAFSIYLGLKLPMPVEPETWKYMISGYVLISAGLPVWLFLQSRDFINVHILYVGIVFLLITLVAAALRGGGHFFDVETAVPMNNWANGTAKLGPGWPVLFVIIACGAVSGFHSLCAGGTTCKQLNNEMAARRVGYYAMLLESFLAVCVVCCLVVGLSMADYTRFCHPAGVTGNPILTFAMGVGYTTHVGLGLPIAYGALGAMLLLEGFLVTTLDTAIRLTRYMIEESWATFFGRYDVFTEDQQVQAESAPSQEIAGTGGLTTEKPPVLDYAASAGIPTSGLQRFFLQSLKHYWVNSGIAVVLMLLLSMGTGYGAIWPIFGSSNQLLAALALLVASFWLMAHRRPVWYTLLPTLFMLATSITALIQLLVKHLKVWPDKGVLSVTAIIVLVVTLGLLVTMIRRRFGADRSEGAFPMA